MRALILAVALTGTAVLAGAQPYQPTWESVDRRPTPAWFTDARFGIFIHWGAYSVPSYAPVIPGKLAYAEWYWNALVAGKGKDPNPVQAGTWEYHQSQYGADFDYKDFAPQFRAELFDPDHWADVFQRSGAKYVVLTSKHHEGFALWPSREASATWGRPWNAVEIGPKRDVLGDLTKAVRAQGAEDGLLLLALRVVQPALALGQAALRPRAHVPAVQGPRDALRAGAHLLRRRVGPALGRVAQPGAAGLALQRVEGEGRGRDQRPLGQGLAPQARRLLDDRVHARDERQRPPLGGEPRHGLLLRLQPRRAPRALPHGARARDRPHRHREPRRQPAARHRAGRRRDDPRDHGAAPGRRSAPGCR